MNEKSEAKQTPLPDLLDHVPDDIVLGIPGDEPMFSSYTNIPIGRLARQAAAELRRLHEQNQSFYAQHASVVSDYEKAVVALKAQRDALLEALKLARSIIGHPDDAHTQMIDAAIKAVEERDWKAVANEAQKHFDAELKRYEGEKK